MKEPPALELAIAQVMRDIWENFYRPNVRQFERDKYAIMKAVMRFGYACNERGWFLDAKFIADEILAVLESMKRHKATVYYLPAYLDSALRNTIGQRAEELSAASRQLNAVIDRAMAGKTVVPAVPKIQDVEVMAALFKSLCLRKPKASNAKQKTLRL